MVPAPAGMSPTDMLGLLYVLSGPRTRGDEPVGRWTARTVTPWSPHPRG